MCKEEFEILFNKYNRPLWWHCYGILNDSHMAQDITSETFVKLFCADNKDWPLEKCVNFIFISSKNACLDYLKHDRVKKKAVNYLFENSDTVEDDYIESVLIKFEVMELIAKSDKIIPESRMRIIKMKFLDDMEYEEISKELKITVNTIRVQVMRGLEDLKNIYLNKYKDERCKQVIGTSIKTSEEIRFPSVFLAAQKVSRNVDAIYKVLCGKHKSSGGYYWRYANPK